MYYLLQNPAYRSNQYNSILLKLSESIDTKYFEKLYALIPIFNRSYDELCVLTFDILANAQFCELFARHFPDLRSWKVYSLKEDPTLLELLRNSRFNTKQELGEFFSALKDSWDAYDYDSLCERGAEDTLLTPPAYAGYYFAQEIYDELRDEDWYNFILFYSFWLSDPLIFEKFEVIKPYCHTFLMDEAYEERRYNSVGE